MNKVFLLSTVFFLFFFIGCDKNEIDGSSEPIFGESTEVDIQLFSEDLTRTITGKVSGTTTENKISWLEFYVFDHTGNTPDPEVGKVGDVDGNGYIRLEGSGLNRKLRVSAGDHKKFIIVANGNIGAMADGETYNTLKKKLASGEFKANASSLDHNARTVPSNGFEMSGFAEVTVAAGKDNNQVYVSLSRLVSRINTPIFANNTPVELTQQEQIDEVWGANSGITPSDEIKFEFMGYAVINGRHKSTISFVGNDVEVYSKPKDIEWNKWDEIAGRNNLLSSFENKFYKNNYSGQDEGKWFLDGTKAEDTDRVYVYENKPKKITVDGVPGYDPESVIAYVIEGKLSTGDGSTAQTRYWRVNIHKGDIYHVMRNCVYKVKIDKISTPGHGTPEEAEKPGIIPEPGDTIADFVISVDQWDINEYATEM